MNLLIDNLFMIIQVLLLIAIFWQAYTSSKSVKIQEKLIRPAYELHANVPGSIPPKQRCEVGVYECLGPLYEVVVQEDRTVKHGNLKWKNFFCIFKVINTSNSNIIIKDFEIEYYNERKKVQWDEYDYTVYKRIEDIDIVASQYWILRKDTLVNEVFTFHGLHEPIYIRGKKRADFFPDLLEAYQTREYVLGIPKGPFKDRKGDNDTKDIVLKINVLSHNCDEVKSVILYHKEELNGKTGKPNNPIIVD